MSDIHARIRTLREAAGLSMEALAALVHVSWQTVQQWENGKTAPKRTRLDRVAEALKTTPEYLSTGLSFEESAAKRHMLVHLVDARASAGRGELVVSEDVNSELAFRRSWLEKKGVKSPADVLAFEVEGTSMIDLCIPHGATVLANRKLTEPVPKGVYVVWLDGKLFVKQLVQDGGRWVARSHNQARADDLPDVPVGRDDRIEGKVFWCGFGL